MNKRILSVILVASLLLPFIMKPDSMQVNAYDNFDSGNIIVEGSAAIDILLNAGTSSTVKAGELAPLVEVELKKLLESDGSDTQVRISTSNVDLDTSDLSDWYVYDHYDVRNYVEGTTAIGTYANNNLLISENSLNNSDVIAAKALWEAENAKYGYKEELRPWFPINAGTTSIFERTSLPNLSGADKEKTSTSLSFDSSKLPKMTVVEWVDRTYRDKYSHPTNSSAKNDGRPHNYSTTGSDDTLGVFDKHIYNHTVNGVAMIDFVGYYTSCFTDFAFYPCSSEEEKRVTFDIDASGVNAHSLNGAGFFINAGLDSNGYLHGYYLYYNYGGTTISNGVYTPSTLALYKLNGNTHVNDIHNAYGNNSTNTNTENSTNAPNTLINKSTKIADTEVKINGNPDINWNPLMNIKMTITPTTLIVEQKPQNSDVWDKVIDFDGSSSEKILSNTGFNGFGPLVHYRQIGHACVRASQFTYSNIKMSYINQSDEIFKVLSEANYVQNADLYFIDLTDDGKNRALNEDGTDAAAYMQAKEITYITNNIQDELLGNNGPLGEYGTVIKNTEGTAGEKDAEELAKKIAKYIFDTYKKNLTDTDGKDYGDGKLPLSTPVAILKLVSDLTTAENGKSYIDIVKRDLISGNFPIYGYDVNSCPSEETDSSGVDSSGVKAYNIKKYNYEITYADGTTTKKEYTTANQKDKTPLFTITNDRAVWPVGEYTVTLTVTDDSASNNISAPVTVKFVIIEDVTAPLVPTVEVRENAVSFTAADIDEYDYSKKDGVFNTGIASYELTVTPKNGSVVSFSDGVYTESDGILIREYSLGQSKGEESFYEIPLPTGEYTATLTVYDAAGNKTVVEIPHIDYENETVAGLTVGKDYGNTASDGFGTASDSSINISNIIGAITLPNTNASKNYTTSNSVEPADDRTLTSASNDSKVTVVIPARPSAPAGVELVFDSNGTGTLNDVDDTMEYSSDGINYTPVPNDATSVTDLPYDDYKVRYKAVPGESFTSLEAEVGNSYTVTFISNIPDGESIDPQTVKNGEKADAPEINREQYILDGWYADTEFNSEWDFESDVITESTTLYAKWTRKTYTLTVEVNKDDSPWIDDMPVITLVPADGATSSDGIGNATTGSDGVTFEVWNGTYKIYANNEHTEKTIEIATDDASMALCYYTVCYDVEYDGTATSGSVGVKYGDSDITSGDIVLGGKDLVLTAQGGGANAYTYSWSDDSSTGSTKTIYNLDHSVDTVCTITGINAGIVVNGYGLDSLKVGVTVNDDDVYVTYTITDETLFSFESDGIFDIDDFIVDNLPDGLSVDGVPTWVDSKTVRINITGTLTSFSDNGKILKTAEAISYDYVDGAGEVDIVVTGVVSVTIAKGDVDDLPELDIAYVTIHGGSDGMIAILDPNTIGKYEYKLSTESDSEYRTANTDSNGYITGLPAGTYDIREKETDNYNAGNSKTVTVNQPNLVTITVKKDDAVWADCDRNLTLVSSSGEECEFSLSSDNDNNGYTFYFSAEDGTYKIYDGDDDTGISVAVNGNSTKTLEYYTVNYVVEDDSSVSNSEISATCGDLAINSGGVVLKNKNLVITVANTIGANAYSYEWSNQNDTSSITGNETTSTVTISNITNSVDVKCTINGLNAQIAVSGKNLENLKIGKNYDETDGIKIVYTLTDSYGFKYANSIKADVFKAGNLPSGLTAGTPVRVSDYVVEILITGTPEVYSENPIPLNTAESVSYENVEKAIMGTVNVTGTVSVSLIKPNGAKDYNYAWSGTGVDKIAEKVKSSISVSNVENAIDIHCTVTGSNPSNNNVPGNNNDNILNNYTIIGNVLEDIENQDVPNPALPGVVVTVVKGVNDYGSTITDEDGNFTLNDIPAGIYNLVLVYTDPNNNGKTTIVTVILTINEDTTSGGIIDTGSILMLIGRKNTIFEPHAEVPVSAVAKLNEVFDNVDGNTNDELGVTGEDLEVGDILPPPIEAGASRSSRPMPTVSTS